MPRFFILICLGILVEAVLLTPANAEELVLPQSDRDFDGLFDIDESIYGTDIMNPDTDGDGFFDGQEVQEGYSPLFISAARMKDTDFDKDGLSDALELVFQTSVTKADSDEDGFSDGDEVFRGFDPHNAAREAKLSRKIEVNLSTQQLSFLVNDRTVFEAPVSTGNIETPTPVGTFSVQAKIPVKRFTGAGYDFKNVLWNLQFKPGYYLHTAYWHNDFGKRTRSHGCINMREKDMEFLYKYIDVGVPVVTIGKTPKKRFIGT